MLTDHPQDDLLIALALIEHAVTLEDCDPDRADYAHDLAREIVADHGLTLEDLPRQIDYNWLGE